MQTGMYYRLVSRVARGAFFYDDEGNGRFVDSLMRVDFSCCMKAGRT